MDSPSEVVTDTGSIQAPPSPRHHTTLPDDMTHEGLNEPLRDLDPQRGNSLT